MSSRKDPLILITEPEYFTPTAIRLMKEVGQVVAKRLSRDELIKIVPRVNVLVVRIETKLDRSVLKFARSLDCVISATTGTDHIDVDYLKFKRIRLYSLTGIHSVSTAEHAIALMVSAVRKIPMAHRDISKGIWNRWVHIGGEIQGKTLGIIGLGRIGSEVAKRVVSLGLKIIACDPYLSGAQIRARGATKVILEELLTESDFVSIHAPLTVETEGMIDSKELAQMKSSAIIINTARGSIIRERALLWALQNNKITAAALDVYDQEPLLRTSPLINYTKSHSNLILTPHLGASTKETVDRAALWCAETMVNFYQSRKGTKKFA